MKSVLANFYGRVMFGQKIEDSDAWRLLDEVITYDRSKKELGDVIIGETDIITFCFMT